jgi:hypothetical protein
MNVRPEVQRFAELIEENLDRETNRETKRSCHNVARIECALLEGVGALVDAVMLDAESKDGAMDFAAYVASQAFLIADNAGGLGDE